MKVLNGSTSGTYKGKTFDLLGVPPEASSKFRMTDFLESTDGHFRKTGLDYVVLDVRNMTPAQAETVMNHINSNYASQLQRLIVLK
jgi:hypothetical protein